MNRLVLFLLMVLSLPALAIQSYSVSDGDSIKIKVSAKDLTRIRMDAGRIDGVWGLDENFTHKGDRSKGEIYIRPKPGSSPVSSFFVKDGYGSVYSVVAVQHAIPSETVVLKSLSRPQFNESRSKRSRASGDVENIKRLAKAMAKLNSISGYSKDVKDEIVELWKDIELTLVSTYTGRNFLGEVYTIKNKSDDKHVFHESEFKGFGKRVRFAALDKATLQTNEMTRLYIIREAK